MLFPVVVGFLTTVALRKESVDRNREQFKYVVQCRVALRKESVDRNCDYRDDVPD